MIKIENFDVFGWEAAIRGMRNPMNSWDKSDSFVCREAEPMTLDEIDAECGHCPHTDDCPIFDKDPHFIVGPNDLKLMKTLIKAGTDHRKFLRMINVTMDITAPLYWWKEFDTYKVGTVANSCSTMHKIHEKEFTIEDFSCEHLEHGYLNTFKNMISMLNYARVKFLETKDKFYWWQMIQLLPTSYNQKRTVQLNYEVLMNMYKSRKNHKLDEWIDFCEEIKKLPYLEEFINEQ